MGRSSFVNTLLAWALACACVAQLGLACAPPGAANEVALGDETYVCLVFSPLDWTAGNQSFVRAMIKPTADKFSRFTISDGASRLYALDRLRGLQQQLTRFVAQRGTRWTWTWTA